MSIVRNTLWWLAFIIAGITVQGCIPGLDVLVLGVIILLQEKDYRNLLWLLPLFILLQEGMGTRSFGVSIVWYTAVLVLFKVGSWLFEVENFLFVFLLSACLGAAGFGVAWLMAPVQNIPFNEREMLDASLVQALFLPF
ncbi:MAG: hypothetical protein Q4F27_06285, partial [Desulfovibrionaceae bacterium]|nr:hypothetical protein [Desulfovibrionaceae bacterium]